MKRHTPDEIHIKLAQADAERARGRALVEICNDLGISEQTLHRWRQQYGEFHTAAGKRLRELRSENARLKRHIAELTLDRQMLQQLAQKKGRLPNSGAPPCASSGSNSMSPSAARAVWSGSIVRRSGAQRPKSANDNNA